VDVHRENEKLKMKNLKKVNGNKLNVKWCKSKTKSKKLKITKVKKLPSARPHN
jgi:hypothetical protein